MAVSQTACPQTRTKGTNNSAGRHFTMGPIRLLCFVCFRSMRPRAAHAPNSRVLHLQWRVCRRLVYMHGGLSMLSLTARASDAGHAVRPPPAKNSTTVRSVRIRISSESWPGPSAWGRAIKQDLPSHRSHIHEQNDRKESIASAGC